MSGRRAEAAAALVRLGLDPEGVGAGLLSEADVALGLAAPEGRTLAAALAEFPHPAVAALLVSLEPTVQDRAVRKEIRRTLYRLRQRGVPVPASPSPPAASSATPVAEGFLSAFDALGDRVVWIVRPLPAGALLVDALVNEPRGLGEIHVAETSRKRLRAVRQQMESEMRLRLVGADWRTLDALLVEAHERAGGGREHDYLRIRPRLTTEPPRAPAEPLSTRVARPAPEELQALAAGSAALLEEPELRGWYPTPEGARPFVEEIRTIRESPLVVSPIAQEERVREVLRRAAGALFPPAVLTRRLAGTAYVLAETGREPAARLALAVARLLEERPADAMDVPFVALLVERGVGALLAESAAREEDARRGALVVTPGQFLRDRASSRPARTRG